jgi:hypothetical protein
MRKATSFKSFEQFRSEILSHRAGPLVSPVDEIVDELYHNDIQEEFDSLWDKAGDDE